MRAARRAALGVALLLVSVLAVAAPSPQGYSADALYNQANAYARAGKPGLAVLNYERAALLAPNDADIVANLEHVRTAAHVSAEPRTRFERMALAVSPTQAAWLGCLGLVLAGSSLLVWKAAPRYRGVTAGAFVLLGAPLVTLAVSNALLLQPHLREAVVLIDKTHALVAPVPMSEPAFTLPEAETVTVTDRHEDYILVRTRGGLSGWVARANLGNVVPQ